MATDTQSLIAFDPGYDRLGVAIAFVKDGTFIPELITCIQSNRSLEHHERLRYVSEKVSALMKSYAPQHCILEELYFSKNSSTALKVAELRGVLLLAAAEHGAKVSEYNPMTIKAAITGSGRANKQALQAQLEQEFKLSTLQRDEKLIDDAVDALAVAYTHFLSSRLGARHEL